MLRSARGWLAGWKETLIIRFRHPDLYRQLCEPLDMNDFGEVGPPE
jgi:hypothetical protein